MILNNVSIFFVLFLLYIAYCNYNKDQDVSSELATFDNQIYVVSNDELKEEKSKYSCVYKSMYTQVTRSYSG